MPELLGDPQQDLQEEVEGNNEREGGRRGEKEARQDEGIRGKGEGVKRAVNDGNIRKAKHPFSTRPTRLLLARLLLRSSKSSCLRYIRNYL